MDTLSPSIRALAGRLLALEAANSGASGVGVHEAVRVHDKLRISLTRFAGPDGFAAIMRRALGLARAEVPNLQTLKVQPDGRIEGLEALATNDPELASKAAVAITAYLLWLLITFIGEALTMKLVREAWPDASLDEETA